MKSNDVIIDRGRGPEINGTRITVYAVLDYVLLGWHYTQIASFLSVASHDVQAAMEYINEHTLEVIKEYAKILERAEWNPPPEIQAKLDASGKKFRELVRLVNEAKARGETDIPAFIRKIREEQAKELTHAQTSGGQ